ncbi:MAG: gliding motility lipoprotein GldH [Saprospiraceae bacterium]|nr:gliding motility lipoprotein GldH [Saprospiraceae bacterium]MCF8250879.1 gliding motility lipoprotein GldH [Saprospiraceae bacterium]MCF8281135.1 gliding motility lipoprotein GldH [Bacteroidales bacterium]MCF8312720.1 gliding motility lipoprotein GldH [Saprospiraceae bacterium]MCF8441167.1 gliding motility lipoprotein GldH [Saprospiraceae bacterium]
MLKYSARPSLLFASFVTFLFACGNGNFFEKTIKITDASWSYENVLPFEFEVTDTTKAYQILLEVNHAGDFGFQNCYVQITTKFPNGEEKKQPVSLELAAQSGIWIGKCSGKDCSIEIPLQGKAKFKVPGKHSITVEQFMRVNPLVGIKAISLKIKQLEK